MGAPSVEIPLTLKSYQSRSIPFSQQRILNAYIEAGSQGTKSQSVIYGTPGTIDFGTVGVGPIYGQEIMDDVLYVVSGSSLYSVSSTGTSTLLGDVGASDTVTMSNNGFQLVVVSGGNGYIYDKDTTTFSQITDADFPGADSVTYIDGYFIFNLGSRLFNSALLDGTSYDALSFANADYGPDTALRVFADHSQLWVFGPNTIEPWYNINGSSFPFAPRQGTVMETGLLSKNTVVKQDRSLFWFGVDKRGGRIMYRSNGYSPVRVSTHPLEQKWDEYSSPEEAVAFSYSQEGHAFVVLVLPGFGCYVYDVTTGEWHERQSYNDNDWRMRNFSNAYNKRIVGDSKSGKLFELDMDTYTEDSGTIIREIVTQTIATLDNKFVRHNRIRIDFDAGVGLTSGQGSDPLVRLAWVNDGQRDFINDRLLSIGAIGEYSKRVYYNRLGKARSRIYRVQMSDPVQFHIKGMYLWVTPGASYG